MSARISRRTLNSYSRAVYAAPGPDAAVNLMSDIASQLGFVGAACVFWPRHRERDPDLPPPALRLAGSRLGPGWTSWNRNYLGRGLFKADFVYRACLRTAVPVLWSYDNQPEIVLGQGRPATLQELWGAESMVRITGWRGGISVPVRGPGSVFGYVVFLSAHHLEELRSRFDDHYDWLLGIAYRFYDASADKLPIHQAREHRLSARELECLALVAVGKTLSESAEILSLSYSTLRFHLRNAASKLGTRNRAQAITKATFLGLLAPPSDDSRSAP